MDSFSLVPYGANDKPCAVRFAAGKRDEEFWFEDGNIVLVAGETHFRVYKGPLRHHSLVFRDMLGLPQPEIADCYSPEYAVVNVADSPEDLRHFLRVLIAGNTLRSTCFVDPSFDELSALIRLGHKYQVDHLVQSTLEYLKQYFTNEADVWFAQTALMPPRFRPIHAIGVVNLARLTRTDWLLPTALMACCELGHEITEGFAREDGTRETLSLADLGRCFAGKTRLAEANVATMHAVFAQDVAECCQHPGRCKYVLRKLLNALLADVALAKSMQWYESWQPFVDRVDSGRELCWRCYRMVTETRQETQEAEIFCKLPEMMGVEVEGWAEESKKKRASSNAA